MKAIGSIVGPKGEADLLLLEIRPEEAGNIADLIWRAVDLRSPGDAALRDGREDEFTQHREAVAMLGRARHRVATTHLAGEEAVVVYRAFMWSAMVHANDAANKRPWARARTREKVATQLLGLVEHSLVN